MKLMFKTFVFTTALIGFVVLVSFGILYGVLPGYYGYSKAKALNKNADALAAQLPGMSEEGVKEKLAEFCDANNAVVNSFGSDGNLLMELSYPMVMLANGANMGYSVTIVREGSDMLRIRQGAEITEDLGERTERFTFTMRRAEAGSLSVIRDVNSDIVERLEIIGTLQPINEAQGVVVSLMPYLLALDILISLVAAYFYSRRITEPIIKLSEAAENMRRLEPGIVSEVEGDDEIALLSQNLNSLYEGFCATLEQLNREMAKVSEMEKSKTYFMGAASHELKTPLAALYGIIEGMIDGVGVYSDKGKYLKESKKLIDRLAAIVDEILTASRLEYLSETLSPKPVDISGMIESILMDYEAIASESIDWQSREFTCFTDEKLIRTALSNIISNGVKYADGGVKIYFDGDTLSVENRCAGIPQEYLERVFEPFFVLDYSRDRSKSGTGIGLFIVRKNLNALGIPHELVNTDSGVRFNIYFKDFSY